MIEPTTPCENYICGFASRIAKDKWDEIDKDIEGIDKTKEKLVYSLYNDFEKASWFVTEVMHWGMDKDYLGEMKTYEYNDFFVIRISDTYIRFKWNKDICKWETEFVEPKTKEVVYFE